MLPLLAALLWKFSPLLVLPEPHKKLEGLSYIDNVPTCELGANVPLGACVTSRGNACFPSFMIIGAMKAGTGALMKWLNTHPHIQSGEGTSSGRKRALREVHFFDRLQATQNPCPTHGQHKTCDAQYCAATDYLDAFASDTITFDKTPSYIRNATAMRRIHDMFPDMKLVVLLRDPIHRAHSGFLHHCRHRRYVEIATSSPVLMNALKNDEAALAEVNLGQGTDDRPHIILSHEQTSPALRDIYDRYAYKEPSSATRPPWKADTSDSEEHARHLGPVCAPEDFDAWLAGLDSPSAASPPSAVRRELSVGAYAPQLLDVLNAGFKPEQIQILFMEEMRADTEAALQTVTSFIGLIGDSHNFTAHFRQGNDGLPTPRSPVAVWAYMEELAAWVFDRMAQTTWAKELGISDRLLGRRRKRTMSVTAWHTLSSFYAPLNDDLEHILGTYWGRNLPAQWGR